MNQRREENDGESHEHQICSSVVRARFFIYELEVVGERLSKVIKPSPCSLAVFIIIDFLHIMDYLSLRVSNHKTIKSSCSYFILHNTNVIF